MIHIKDNKCPICLNENLSWHINIIKSGQIIESKPYSVNEATLVVSKSKKIYICSISNDLTKCILSGKKNKIN